jgi:putative phosphoesterase
MTTRRRSPGATTGTAAPSGSSRRSSGRRLEHESKVVPTRAEGQLDVVVVADTHGQAHPRARPLIARLAPDLILHAGDIGDASVLDPLREIAPLYAVRGNIDGRAPGFVDSMDIDFVAGERSVLKVLLLHIAVYGPKLRAEVARLATDRSARIVLCGHSHVPFLGRDKGLILFNPGSIGPRRFQLPITFGLLQITSQQISLRHISCETGETWLPA